MKQWVGYQEAENWYSISHTFSHWLWGTLQSWIHLYNTHNKDFTVESTEAQQGSGISQKSHSATMAMPEITGKGRKRLHFILVRKEMEEGAGMWERGVEENEWFPGEALLSPPDGGCHGTEKQKSTAKNGASTKKRIEGKWVLSGRLSTGRERM